MQRIFVNSAKRVMRNPRLLSCSVTKGSSTFRQFLPISAVFCQHSFNHTPTVSFIRNASTAVPVAESEEQMNPKDARNNEVLKSIPGSKTTSDVMIIVFTCKVCNTRAARKMSKEAYNHGVVLIRCPGCNNLHLIADHLGYFDDNSTNVEQILAQKGEKVTRMDDKQVMEFLHSEDLK
ncbi:hypothetical protein WA171_007112 [Blastocystis sp. BT1]